MSDSLYVPRLKTTFSYSTVRLAVLEAVQKMGDNQPTPDQFQAIEAFLRGKDILICLPTGSGKSVCFACLPHVFDVLRSYLSETLHQSIVVVVSPLSSLMQDQVCACGKERHHIHFGYLA